MLIAIPTLAHRVGVWFHGTGGFGIASPDSHQLAHVAILTQSTIFTHLTRSFNAGATTERAQTANAPNHQPNTLAKSTRWHWPAVGQSPTNIDPAFALLGARHQAIFPKPAGRFLVGLPADLPLLHSTSRASTPDKTRHPTRSLDASASASVERLCQRRR